MGRLWVLMLWAVCSPVWASAANLSGDYQGGSCRRNSVIWPVHSHLFVPTLDIFPLATHVGLREAARPGFEHPKIHIVHEPEKNALGLTVYSANINVGLPDDPLSELQLEIGKTYVAHDTLDWHRYLDVQNSGDKVVLTYHRGPAWFQLEPRALMYRLLVLRRFPALSVADFTWTLGKNAHGELTMEMYSNGCLLREASTCTFRPGG